MTASPLHDTHARLGATFTDFAGWEMPLRYGSETTEHHTVRQAAGLFDLSHMGEIEVTGPAAGEALDAALVGDLSGLAVGRARYTMLCAEDGGVLDDLVVYRLDEHRYLVVANAANTAVVLDALAERAAGFAATVDDRTAAYALVAVQGPAAAAIVAAISTVSVEGIRYYAAAPGEAAGRAALVARTGYTGEDGFELFVDAADATAVWDAALDAGSDAGLRPAGLSCRDTLRLEAGMPLYGHELHPGVTPYEAGLGRVVKLDKPAPFAGREALAAREARGPTARLVGLAARGRRVPRAGYAVVDPATGEPVGTVTSGAPSPTLGVPIAMAYVPPALAEPGTALAVDIRGTAEPADVVALPFYRRPAGDRP